MFIKKPTHTRVSVPMLTSIPLLLLTFSLAACGPDAGDDGGEHDDDHEHSAVVTGEDGPVGPSDGGSPSDSGSGAGSAATPSAFVLSSLVSSGDESMAYVTVLESLDGQTVDYANSREFSGNADTWVYDGAVFVVDAETLAITKYTLEGDRLEEAAKLSLGAYGPKDVGFWVNVFISPTKAYFGNPPDEYIVWNPTTMEISGTIPLPDMPDRGALTAVFSYADRAAIVRDNLLFHTVYWATEDYFSSSEDSKIMVFDTDTDELVDVLDAPCPGLDYGTRDEDDNVYFSSWVYAPGGAAVLDSPQTCVVKVPNSAELTAERAFNVADVTEGREGGALRHLGDGKAMMAVLHDERARENGETDVMDVTFGANWRFWSYDLTSGAAAVIDSIDWSAGAAYTTTSGDVTYMLVPTGEYESTIVYEIGLDGSAKPVLEAPGWALRLFPLE